MRSHTGGPLGWRALVHRDLRRAIRTPQPYVLLAGLVLVPYAAAEADAGRAVVLATTLAGLLGGPALCAGLRVVVRTEGLARMMPFRRQTLLLAHLVVPGAALMLFALATTPTLVREVAGRRSGQPGDRVRPLLRRGDRAVDHRQAAELRGADGQHPAGGAPTGVIFSVARGFTWGHHGPAADVRPGRHAVLVGHQHRRDRVPDLRRDPAAPPQQPTQKPGRGKKRPKPGQKQKR